MAVRAREIAFLTDPAAGPEPGRAVARRLADAGFGVRPAPARDGDEAVDAARAAVTEGVEAVVVAGDDALVHHALQAVAGTPVPLGIVPTAGPGEVARLLGLPRRDPVAAADRVVASRTRTVDLGRAGTRWFAGALSAGLPAGGAPARPSVLRADPRPCTLDLDGVPRRTEAVAVVVANAAVRTAGWRTADDARPDDGLLDVVVVRPVDRGRTAAAYARLVRGTAGDEVERHRAARVTVAVTGATAWADGVRVGPLPLTVECVPRALTVLA